MESGAESTRDTLTFHAISSFSETEIVCSTYILLGTSDGKDQVPQNLGLCFWKWQFQFKKSIWNVDQFVVKCRIDSIYVNSFYVFSFFKGIESDRTYTCLVVAYDEHV